jgi:spermidine synthase
MHSLNPDQPAHVGVVGLGAGTIAAYGRTGDDFRFYELDANVIAAARNEFTFLADSAAHTDVVLGDGRISLAHEAPQAFDVLVLDAFSSDSVPVHLLTREAFQIYLRHLKSAGLLLANVSNRHLAVDRVVRESASANNLSCRVIETPTNVAHHVTHVQWAVMGRSPERLNALFGDEGSAAAAASSGVLWTDAQASIFSILR